VRELQNTIRNITVLNEGEEVLMEMLPKGPQEFLPQQVSTPMSLPMKHEGGVAIRPMWQVEDEMIEAAMKETQDNVPRAAALLEMSPSTIYRRLKEKKEI